MSVSVSEILRVGSGSEEGVAIREDLLKYLVVQDLLSLRGFYAASESDPDDHNRSSR